MHKFSTKEDSDDPTNIIAKLQSLNLEIPDGFKTAPKSQNTHFNSMIDYFSSRNIQHISAQKTRQNLTTHIRNVDEHIRNHKGWGSLFNLFQFIINTHQTFPWLSISDWFDAGMNYENSPDNLKWQLFLRVYGGAKKIQTMLKNINEEQHNDYSILHELPSKTDNKTKSFMLHFNNPIAKISPGVGPHYFSGVLALLYLYDGFNNVSAQVPINQMRLENIVHLLYVHNKSFSLRFDEKGNLYNHNKRISSKIKFSDLDIEIPDEIKEWSTINPFLKDQKVQLIENDLKSNGKVFLNAGDTLNAYISWLKIITQDYKFHHAVKKGIRINTAKQKATINVFLEEIKQQREKTNKGKLLEARLNGIEGLLADTRHMFHDINNIIQVFDGNVYFALDELNKIHKVINDSESMSSSEIKKSLKSIYEKSVKHIQKIANGSDNLKRLLNAMHSRYRKGEGKVSSLNINDYVQSAFQYYYQECIKKGIEARLDLGDIPNIDALDLDLLLTTYDPFVNSIKSHNGMKNGKIIASTRFINGYICYKITDCGYGLSEDEISRVFLGEVIREDRPGTRTGLKNILTILQCRYNGYIEVESKGHGRGATFSFYFKPEIK